MTRDVVWYDDRIKKLVSYAYKKLNAEIPLASEILSLNHFLFNIRILWGNKDQAKIERTMTEKKTVFKWFHFGWTRVQTVQLPEDAVWRVVHEVDRTLQSKCNQLAEIVGYKEDEK